MGHVSVGSDKTRATYLPCGSLTGCVGCKRPAAMGKRIRDCYQSNTVHTITPQKYASFPIKYIENLGLPWGSVQSPPSLWGYHMALTTVTVHDHSVHCFDYHSPCDDVSKVADSSALFRFACLLLSLFRWSSPLESPLEFQNAFSWLLAPTRQVLKGTPTSFV